MGRGGKRSGGSGIRREGREGAKRREAEKGTTDARRWTQMAATFFAGSSLPYEQIDRERVSMPSIDMPLEQMRQYKPSLYRAEDFQEFWDRTMAEALRQPLN